jgi:hypothetical protein
MTTHRSARATISLALMSVLLLSLAAGPALAAKGDKGTKADRDTKGDERAKGDKKADADTLPAVIETIAGGTYKMAKAKVAKQLTRIADAPADQVFADGSPAAAAPGYSDIAAVYVAPIRIPRKLLAKMADDYPRGAVGAFYGTDAALTKDDRAVFVAVELADKRPGRSVVQQVEVGLDGEGASPVQVGSAGDTLAGVERFSLSGLFADGSESSGTTDVSGRRPGDAIEYYNARSSVFGLYDARRDSYQLVMPLPSDARAVAVTLRTLTDAGEVIDRLELPAGGHLISLSDPVGGLAAKGAATPLACRSLETFSGDSGVVELDDPTATLIRYTAGSAPPGAAPPGTAEDGHDLLAALDEYEGTIPVTMTRLDVDEEPFDIDAGLSIAPALGSFRLRMEVPAGQWAFAPAEGVELLTPWGESLIDHASLTGRAGVRTGGGLDGFVSGDPGCGRWDLGIAACDLVPADDMAALVGRSADELEQMVVQRPDGAQWCVGMVPATREPQYVARFGTAYVSAEHFAPEVDARGCEAFPLDLGAEGVNLDCSADGYEGYTFRVVPEVTAGGDPGGGLLVSIDMLVDQTRPRGERYDVVAATGVFAEVAAAVAASATPAVSTAGATDDRPAGG